MELGRLDHETTANAGRIRGGTAANVVPERCTVELEARSLDAARVEEVVAAMVDRLNDGANAAECDVDVSVARLFEGFRVPPDAPALAAVEAALRACGHLPVRIATGGGSDANALHAAGLPCLNVANGTVANHQPDERVSAAALEQMLAVVAALLGACARRE
jgi:tripeptide aminopeptidase